MQNPGKVKPILAKEGVDLQVVEFTDYVKPNLSLSRQGNRRNFFQHLPYLEKFCKDRNLSLVSLAKSTLNPWACIPRKSKTLNPCPTAQDRHSQRSHQRGPCPGHPGKSRAAETEGRVGVLATANDIVDNPKNLKITEAEAAMLPRTLDDVDLAVINSNFAMEAKLNPTKDALFIEAKDSPYANIVAVRKGDENRPEIQKLMKALNSPEVKKFIEEKYQGAIIPAF